VKSVADKIMQPLVKADEKQSAGTGQRQAKQPFQISKTKVYAGGIDHEPEPTNFQFRDHG
jgi:hypothetical protein